MRKFSCVARIPQNFCLYRNLCDFSNVKRAEKIVLPNVKSSFNSKVLSTGEWLDLENINLSFVSSSELHADNSDHQIRPNYVYIDELEINARLKIPLCNNKIIKVLSYLRILWLNNKIDLIEENVVRYMLVVLYQKSRFLNDPILLKKLLLENQDLLNHNGNDSTISVLNLVQPKNLLHTLSDFLALDWNGKRRFTPSASQYVDLLVKRLAAINKLCDNEKLTTSPIIDNIPEIGQKYYDKYWFSPCKTTISSDIEQLYKTQFDTEKNYMVSIPIWNNTRDEASNAASPDGVGVDKDDNLYENLLKDITNHLARSLIESRNDWKSHAKSYYSSFSDAFDVDDIKHISDCTVKSLFMMAGRSFNIIPKSHFVKCIKGIIQHRINFKWNEKLFCHQHMQSVQFHLYDTMYKHPKLWYHPRVIAKNYMLDRWDCIPFDQSELCFDSMCFTKFALKTYEQLIVVLSIKFPNPYFYVSNNSLTIRRGKEFIDLVDKYQKYLYFPYYKVPMLVPPKPFIGSYSGGYLTNFSSFINSTENIGTAKLCFERARGDKLSIVLDSLNASAFNELRINDFVLDTLISFANDNAEYHNLNWLQQMIQINTSTKSDGGAGTSSTMGNHYLRNIVSLGCYLRNKTIWLPQYMDFRGRFYPQPNIISHYGGDLERSLLIFAKKKLVGPQGLKQLKIYFSTLIHGSQLLTEDEHLKFTDSCVNTIKETAENPKKNLWWVKQDKIFQILAVCNEIYQTLNNIDSYMSGFPIYIDATCSSFQHVAALTRDPKLAELTNLCGGSNRQDLYIEFCKMLGNYHPDLVVDRKLSKLCLITFLYGNTNLARHSRHKFAIINTQGSITLYNESIRHTMFTEFPSIKNLYIWTNDICRRFKKLDKLIHWDTPFNIPICLFDREYTKITLFSNYFFTVVYPKYFDVTNLENIGQNSTRWKNLRNIKYQHILSNFVQSMDACLMMMVVLECFQKSISVLCIHDSFGTHPVDVNKLNMIGRSCFSRFYSEDHLYNLWDQLNSQLQTNDSPLNSIEPFKCVGDFNVNVVRDKAENMFK